MNKFTPPIPISPEVPQEGFTTKLTVTTMLPTKESRIGIRQADWNRLKRNLQKCKMPLPNNTRKADFLGALCITTCFTIITLFVSKTPVESWIYACFFMITIFSAIFALEFNKIAQSDLKQKENDIAEIEGDMQEIEKNIVQFQ